MSPSVSPTEAAPPPQWANMFKTFDESIPGAEISLGELNADFINDDPESTQNLAERINLIHELPFNLLDPSSPVVLEAILDERITKQTSLKLGGWCQVRLKNQDYYAEIISLGETTAVVKIIDVQDSQNWTLMTFNRAEIKKCVMGKYHDLESLIRGLKNINLLKSDAIADAMRTVDRAIFCPGGFQYYDMAIDLGDDVFISAPHIQIPALELCRDHFAKAKSILDVGSGSGYVTALFSKLSPNAKVIGLEYHKEFVESSTNNVSHLAPELSIRIEFVQGDGEEGYALHAPYDIIYVGFMCEQIPQPLKDQLAPGGRLIIPVGSEKSLYNSACLKGKLVVVDKLEDGSCSAHEFCGCTFVPSLSPFQSRL